MEGTGKTI